MTIYEIITIIMGCLSLICAIISVICSIKSCKTENNIKKIEMRIINSQQTINKSALIKNAPQYNNCIFNGQNNLGINNPNELTNSFIKEHTEEDK